MLGVNGAKRPWKSFARVQRYIEDGRVSKLTFFLAGIGRRLTNKSRLNVMLKLPSARFVSDNMEAKTRSGSVLSLILRAGMDYEICIFPPCVLRSSADKRIVFMASSGEKWG